MSPRREKLRLTGMLDLKCLSPDADNLLSEVYLSSVQNPHSFIENFGLMSNRGDLLGYLVSTLWECGSPKLE